MTKTDGVKSINMMSDEHQHKSANSVSSWDIFNIQIELINQISESKYGTCSNAQVFCPMN